MVEYVESKETESVILTSDMSRFIGFYTFIV
jgi:hypothetical protein